tara:strand:+ start:40586 stop:41260 length:675 start_codon:yes stop_codon:yes gene_type:complete
MTESGQASDFAVSMATVRSWLLLFGATAGFAVFLAVDPYVGAAVLLFLVVVAPPQGIRMRPDFWRPGKPWTALLIYVPFVLLWVAFATGYLRLAELIGERVDPQPQLLKFANGEIAEPMFWGVVVLIVILAPIAEEVLFRGYLFAALSMTVPLWATQLLTATLFGLVHGVGHALPIGVLSLLFGYLRQRYRSLWPSILAHMLHNGVTLALVYSWPGLLDLFYNR